MLGLDLCLLCSLLPLRHSHSTFIRYRGGGSCSSSSDCYPADLNGTAVPSQYINCSDSKCVCRSCFYATNSYKSCTYQKCWMYDATTRACSDLRKDQMTAFFLSFFLSITGAANFYIERYDLGTRLRTLIPAATVYYYVK